MQQSIDRLQQQSFLVLWAKKEDLEAKIQKYKLEENDYKAEIQHADQESEKLSAMISQKEHRKEELITACAQSDVLHEENRLREARKNLQSEQQNIMEQLNNEVLGIKQEAVRIQRLCNAMIGWEHEESLTDVLESVDAVQKDYAIFTDCNYEVFSKPLSLFEKAHQAASALSVSVRNAAYKVKTIIDELSITKDQKLVSLGKLRRNMKDYPKDLLRLKAQLGAELEKRAGHPVSVEILADVLEIAESEEKWRGAVEGYLNTQKFYLLIAPQYYRDAVSIYDQIKQEFGTQSFGLVDIGKLREKESLDPWQNSLAMKVQTENDLARSYIDYLLGRVVCCAHAGQLREFRIAITPEGMLYQGYVVRPLRKEHMTNAFIGRSAVALRIAKTEAELQGTEESLRKWKPIYKVLNEYQGTDVLFTQYFVESVIKQRQADYLRGLKISKELNDIEDQLSYLDLFWLNEQRHQIDLLESELTNLGEKAKQFAAEKAKLLEKIHQLEYDKLPDLNKELVAAEDRIADEFTPVFIDRTGIPRYEQELERLKHASVVYKNFSDRLVQTRNEQENSQKTLFKSRSEYVNKFSPCSFIVEAMDNDEYAREQHILEQSELPKYREKIQTARTSAMEQFQNDFLAKLKSSIDQVQDQVRSLNKALRQAQFGTDRYQFRVDRNPDYAEYYDMIMAPELMEGDAGLFALPFQQKYGKLIDSLFSQIAMSDDTQVNARKQSELQQKIEKFTDFRTYLKFDLETTDQNGSKQLLSQTLNTKSGGETQTPFYIAVLASFAQMYQVNNLSGQANNTVRLVVFDEAFNKMDSERIVESVRLLRKIGLAGNHLYASG